MEEQNYNGCYGAKSSGKEIQAWVKELCEDNFEKEKLNQKRWAGNVWGLAGMSKTAMIEEFRNIPVTYNDKQYAGFEVISIPMAQIEEMGDVLGCPEDFVEMEREINVSNSEDKTILTKEKKYVLVQDAVLKSHKEKGWDFTEDSRLITKNCPPEWVPTEEKPGIILFDDGNRASVRILKGLMQLVQDYKTISWSIPKGWTIMFTGNPDQQDYLVATQDSAMITRQRHITMIPKIEEWAEWAIENGVDSRGVDFLLKYPEMIYSGERTNLRTLTEFFFCLKRHKNLIAGNVNNQKAYRDGMALLDEEVVRSFFLFATRDMQLVIDPIIILDKYDSKLDETIDKLLDVDGKGEERIDILSVSAQRLYAYMVSSAYDTQKMSTEDYQKNIKNFQKFITRIPDALGYSILKKVNSVMKIKEFVLKNEKIRKMIEESLRL